MAGKGEGDDTIVEDGIPVRPMPEEKTAPHQTEPGILQALKVGEPSIDQKWEVAFRRGVAAAAADFRRAIVAELVARKVSPEKAHQVAAAIRRRALGA